MSLLRNTLVLILLGWTAAASADPVIQHDPIPAAQPNRSLSVLARVTAPGSTVQSVFLFYSASADASPVKIAMRPTGTGTWYGVIPEQYTRNPKLFYYLGAQDAAGAWTETDWKVVALSTDAPPADDGRGDSVAKSKWFWPTVVVGGGALAIGGALALSDSGGGDSGSGGGGGEGDSSGPNQEVITASDSVSDNVTEFPKDVVVDATSRIAGRGVSSVGFDFRYNPSDDGLERFQVIYNGSVVIDTGNVLQSGRQAVTVVGGSSQFTVRTVVSILGSGEAPVNQYNWDITATFNLAE